MKKLIFKKFILDVLIFFSTSIFVIGLIVWTIQAVNYFDFVTEDGHGLKVYFTYTLLNFPKIIHRILPFVFFISLFFTIVRYETNNQLNIFWFNGISKIKFAVIVLFFSGMIMFIQIILGSYISPNYQLKARFIIKDSNVDFFTNLLKEGKFINAVKGLTIFIEDKKGDNFSNIFIEDTTRVFNRIIFAKKGSIISNQKDKKLLLNDGMVLNIDNQRINTFEFEQIDFNLNTFASNSIIIPKIQETNSKVLFKCLIYKSQPKNGRCEDDERFTETKQELLKRFYNPVYLILIGILCAFLFISGKFNPNYQKIKINIFIANIFVLLLSETLLRYSTISKFYLLIYFSVPILLFLIICNLYIHKIRYA